MAQPTANSGFDPGPQSTSEGRWEGPARRIGASEQGWRHRFVRGCLRRVLLILALAIVCQSQVFAQVGAREKVLVRFTWKLYGVYAPLFVALDKGYFADEGLSVELAEGSGSENVVKLIAAGTDKIGFGPGIVAAEAVSAGLPVKVIANYMDNNPLGLISFPENPLRTPKDLEGRTVGLATGETFANMIDPFARINSVDLSKVKRVQFDGATRNAQFLARKIDVISVYLNNDLPLLASKLGMKFNVLKAADFGLKLMGTSYFVNNGFARENPEALRKLLRATARGYTEALNNPKEATAMLNKRMAVKMDPAVLEIQVRETLAATTSPAGKPFGWQDEGLWRSNLDLLKAAGSIREMKDLDAYYTNEFLQ
jgi:NitT/TauT family transport system substrate-binding protein